MKIQLKSIVCAIVLAAISLGTAQQVHAAARPIAAGYSWSNRGEERRTVTFVCIKRQDRSIRGWAEFDYTDQGSHVMGITSMVRLKDGTVCMAGPITEHPNPDMIGWTGFFAVRDYGRSRQNPDSVTFLLTAPPKYETAEDILEAIGGSVPEEQFVPIDGGVVKVW